MKQTLKNRHRFGENRAIMVLLLVGLALSLRLPLETTLLPIPSHHRNNFSIFHHKKFTPQKAGFSVKFKDEVSCYHVTPLFVLPGETISLEVENPHAHHWYVFKTVTGSTKTVTASSWLWTAPQKPGTFKFSIIERPSGDTIRFHAFVMIPFQELKGESLNGYRIGHYPHPPKGKSPIYNPPLGFIEVTPNNKNMLISPHFRLGQFVCKESGSYPKYVVLRERLLLKLEGLLEKINKEGIACPSLAIMSGYRTPSYNTAIGNVRFSRHQWGDAADIYIDTKNRGTMDDLNNDGRVDEKDAEILFQIVSNLNAEQSFEKFHGGLGRYRSTRAHGPFVHIDARGFDATWKE